MSLIDKTKRAVGTASAVAAIIQVVAKAEWSPEDGRLQRLRVLGIPVFDRARMEARRARRRG